MLNGKYADLESSAWIWIFIQLLPGLGLLLSATLLHSNRGKAILRGAFWAITGLTTLFLLFVLTSLAGISSGSAGQSLSKGFAGSYRYLLPMQGFVLTVFAVLFFKKESLFVPDEKALVGLAQDLLAKAKVAGAIDRQRVIDLFVAADMPAMLDLLEMKIRAKQSAQHRLNEVLLLKNSIAHLRRHADYGITDDRETRREHNRICLAALELTEEV
ncbi:MAG: hypothetical protein IPH31_10350 [Lewinellaceae bacterium]|nr:hypothetical protein [Lewinellaceae bacterium]